MLAGIYTIHMEHIKITQLVTEQWVGTDGKNRTEILGLGDDGLLYRWHKGSGKWVLNIINN